MTGIGVLSAAAFNVWDHDFIATAVFLGAVPLVATMIFVLWVSQVLGMLEVGGYLWQLEKMIREGLEAPKALMTWEDEVARRLLWTWPPTHELYYPAVLALFALITTGSLVLGASHGFGELGYGAIAVALAVGIVSAAFLYAFHAAVRATQQRRAKMVNEAKKGI